MPVLFLLMGLVFKPAKNMPDPSATTLYEYAAFICGGALLAYHVISATTVYCIKAMSNNRSYRIAIYRTLNVFGLVLFLAAWTCMFYIQRSPHMIVVIQLKWVSILFERGYRFLDTLVMGAVSCLFLICVILIPKHCGEEELLMMLLAAGTVPIILYYNNTLAYRQRVNFTLQKNIAAHENSAKGILYNMLPTTAVADILASNDESVNIGNNCNIVILFSDIVGFTPLSAKLPALELVKILDTLYKIFDRLVDDCGLWKMDTIGDAYVVVGIVEHPDQKVEICKRMAHLGNFMIEALQSFRLEFPAYNLKMRIGINAGPAVAGVVGDSQPRYHIYGKTLLVANDLESSGTPGCLHMSKEVFMDLQECFKVRNPDGEASLVDHSNNCKLTFMKLPAMTSTSGGRVNAENAKNATTKPNKKSKVKVLK
jgi:class 3 adenylate cyclase